MGGVESVREGSAGVSMNVNTATDSGARSLPAEFSVGRGGNFGVNRLWRSQAGLHGFGLSDGWDASDLADEISQISQATIPLVVANQPGVIYQTNPQTGAVMVYSQPTGNTQNLPVGQPLQSYNPYTGTYQPTGVAAAPNSVSAVGSVSGNTLLMLGGLAVVAILLMKK